MSVDLMSANVNTIERIMTRLFKIEYGIVVHHDRYGDAGVQCRNDPDGKLWNTVTVKIRSTKTKVGRSSPKGKNGDPYNVMHYYCAVLQGYTQKWGGNPYMPRIGDMVAVLFMFNQMPLVLGTVHHIEQDPVCRAPFDIKDPEAIDARYDDVDKWCQWRNPEWNADMEVTEHKPGKHPICEKKFHRTRDYIRVFDCIQGDKDPCDRCVKLDRVKRCSGQWEKIYSCDTDSCDCQHPFTPHGVCYTKKRHEWHEPSGSYFLFQNNPCGDLDFGKGLIRLANARSECSNTTGCDSGQKSHINMDPRGTIDLHTRNEPQTAHKDENEGTRVSVVSLEDDTVLYSIKAIDFNKNSYIEIRKDGDIFLSSLNGSSNMALKGTEEKIYINGIEDVQITAGNDITNEAGNFIYETCQDHIISTHCTHPTCSCSDSDERLKTNVESLSYGLQTLECLNPVKFNFIKIDDGKHLGFIAQDMVEVIPEVVETRTDTGLMGIRYDELIPVLVSAIKELNTRVKILESKLLERDNKNDN